MLGDGNGGDLIASLWHATAAQARLPEHDAAEYFGSQGPLPTRFDSRRAFHRFFLRQRGVMLWEGKTYGIYTRDISRQGVGFLAPVQLMPLDEVGLLLPEGRKLKAEVKRCRRLEGDCYLIGAEFATSETASDAASA